jgi:hypothetical protein
MRKAHADAQKLFRDIGIKMGFKYQKTWNQRYPTDGVWVAKAPTLPLEELPLVALEVSNTESPKELAGSVAVLEEVSPSLGLLVLQDEDLRRRHVRKGDSIDEIGRILAVKLNRAHELIAKSRQRIEVWTFAQLKHRHRLASSGCSSILSIN